MVDQAGYRWRNDNGGEENQQFVTSDGANGCVIYNATGDRSSTTSFRFHVDLRPDEWEPTTPIRVYSAGNDMIFELQAGGVHLYYFNGTDYPWDGETAATLGLVDGERAQIAVVVDTDADTATWHVRKGGLITGIDSLADWGASLAVNTISGTATGKAAATNVAANVMNIDGADTSPSVTGDFFGIYMTDLDNTETPLHMTAANIPNVDYGTTWTGEDGETWGIYYNPTQGWALSPAATWAAAEDTGITEPVGVTRRLRIVIDDTGNPAATQFKLRFRRQGDAATEWEDLN